MNNQPTSPKILVVDDDADIVELLQYNLEKEGYQVATASDGRKALEIAPRFLPDLVLLDIMMPQLDGIETARLMRQIPELKQMYLVFLTARSEEYSEIVAFEVGADDYLNKPIKPRALMSRLKAYFRRESQKNETEDRVEIGDLVINRSNYSVVYRDTPLVLPKKEFELLYFFAQNPGKVFNREELLQKVWGADVYVVERTIDVHIRKLREKINENYIKTFKGVGYLFSVEP
jgi:two-component system, OmpR family, alkaline phosphatase synthesis response regulator PhoP